MKYNALIVEDDLDIAYLLKEALAQLDIESDLMHDGKQALHHALATSYDLILLDVMLPKTSGFEICRALRNNKPDQVILIISAKDSEPDRIQGLEFGADDYIQKPFSIGELQARIKGQLRKLDRLNKIQDRKPTKNEKISIEELSIDLNSRSVNIANTKIDLTSIEFDLLVFFAKYPKQVFSRNDLLDQVWGSEHSGYEHTVNTHINRLRNKIEIKHKWIHTIWGVGYQFYKEEKVEN